LLIIKFKRRLWDKNQYNNKNRVMFDKIHRYCPGGIQHYNHNGSNLMLFTFQAENEKNLYQKKEK